VIVTPLKSPIPVPDAVPTTVRGAGLGLDPQGRKQVLMFVGPPDLDFFVTFALCPKDAGYLRDALGACLEKLQALEEDVF
jgi:hypothetical protein